MGLSKHVTYKRNDVLLALSLSLSLLTLVNYYFFFDILAPGIGNAGGSVKASMGAVFIVPIILLTFGQTIYTSGVLHLVIRSFFFDKRDYLKALFVSSVVVLFYSVFYTIFPTWGPYLYIVGTFRGVSALGYMVLAGWTAFIIIGTALLIRRMYGFKKGQVRWSMLILLSAAMLTLVLAMAD